MREWAANLKGVAGAMRADARGAMRDEAVKKERKMAAMV